MTSPASGPAQPQARGAGGLARSIVLGGLAALGIVAYLDIRPSQDWIIWLTAVMAGLGTEGIVRTHPEWHPFRGAPALSALISAVLPALAVLSLGFFIGHAVDGYGRNAAGIGAGVAVGVVAYGEYQTVAYGSRVYGAMRLLLAIASYLIAFGLFAVLFAKDVDVAWGAAAVGVAACLLAAELLRESRVEGWSSIVAGLAVGLSLAEFWLALYFFPLDALLAGALLVIGFYLATGIVHHLFDHDLSWVTAAEYVLVTVVGTAAVVVTRSAV